MTNKITDPKELEEIFFKPLVEEISKIIAIAKKEGNKECLIQFNVDNIDLGMVILNDSASLMEKYKELFEEGISLMLSYKCNTGVHLVARRK